MGNEPRQNTQDYQLEEVVGDNSMTEHQLLGVMMFMVNFEIPVVATSVVAITDDLGGAKDRSWFLTSYLLGYVG
ncbi:hypothetical protein Hte_002783 [Hypoxylon texense]